MSHNNNVTTTTANLQHYEPTTGIWIGIDFGTSNCTCAVWDSNRGRPKWMRLPIIAPPESISGGKQGRIVPSVVLLETPNDDDTLEHEQQKNMNNTKKNDKEDELLYCKLKDGTKRKALVGYAALQEIQKTEHDRTGQGSLPPPPQQQDLLIRSVKRLLGITRQEDLDADWIQSLPFEVVEQNDELWIVTGSQASGTTTTTSAAAAARIRPVDIVTILLRSIRYAAQTYLRRNLIKKHMNVPGGSSNLFDDDTSSSPVEVLNCVVGVPAYFSQRQCALMEQACHMAGFTGHVSFIVESTAAAMAYGLFVGNSSATTDPSHKKRILVLDMGGGTTDITIAEMTTPMNDDEGSEEDDETQPTFTVVVTDGDHRLGGDDMDQALLQWLLQKIDQLDEKKPHTAVVTRSARTLLLQECRRVKEYLCGDGQDAMKHPDSSTLYYKDTNSGKTRSMEVLYRDFATCIAPLLQRVEKLVRSALQQYQSKSANGDSTAAASLQDDSTMTLASKLVDEVVLVGGGTRVPAVRDLLRRIFDPISLCLSVNAMSAVAEGAAIQAAIKSQLVPTYELQSALMLDTLPHAIGIAVATNSGDDGMDENQNLESLLQTDQQKRDHKKGFVEILPKDAPLPAFGTATFALARVDQPGFTLTAVEDVGSKFPLQKIQQFTFLLHRLRPEQLTAMERRTIEIEMRMETDGKLIVSFFDSNDPEHVQKMMKRQKQSMDAEKQPISTTVNPDVMTMDQIALVVACAVLFVLYVVVKLMFHTPEENARIV